MIRKQEAIELARYYAVDLEKLANSLADYDTCETVAGILGNIGESRYATALTLVRNHLMRQGAPDSYGQQESEAWAYTVAQLVGYLFVVCQYSADELYGDAKRPNLHALPYPFTGDRTGELMNLSEMPEVGQRVAVKVAFYDSADETAERVGSLVVQATVTRVWTNGRYVTVKTDPYIASDNGAEISRIFTRIYSELLEV